MKTLLVGDLHGNREIVEAALAQKYAEKVVFVGDYLDSYNRSSDDQVITLILVLDAIEKDPENVKGLLGNHELSYMVEGHQCSGWNSVTDTLVQHLRTRALALLHTHLYVGDYLVTHAGLNQGLLEHLDMTAEEYLEAGDFDQIGRARGGNDKFGGIYWNDYNMEFEPVPGLKQVFGHTHYRVYTDKEIRTKGGPDNISFNIDVLPPMTVLNTKFPDEAFGLVIDDETGNAEVVDILNI